MNLAYRPPQQQYRWQCYTNSENACAERATSLPNAQKTKERTRAAMVDSSPGAEPSVGSAPNTVGIWRSNRLSKPVPWQVYPVAGASE